MVVGGCWEVVMICVVVDIGWLVVYGVGEFVNDVFVDSLC